MSTQDRTIAYAHNWHRSGNGCIPVITEDAYHIPTQELSHDWHPASNQEYQAYEDYWNAKYDAFDRGEISAAEL